MTGEISLDHVPITLQTVHEKVKVKLSVCRVLKRFHYVGGVLRPATGVGRGYQEASLSLERGRKMV